MTLFLIALFLAEPPTEYPISSKVAVIIAFAMDVGMVRSGYMQIMRALIEIKHAIKRRD